jgi:GH15 family glucan-1,4-alpha-glucosidase
LSAAGPHNGLNLGVVGNCQIAALIDERARVVWACLPRPDADPVFSALLFKEGGDSARGVFAVDLVDFARGEQRYLRNSAVLETVLHDSHGGSVRVLDFCPRFRSRGRMHRPMMLIRTIEPGAGRPLVRLRLRPTSHHGKVSESGAPASHHLRFSAEGVNYRVTTDSSLSVVQEERPIVLEKPLTFIVGPDETIEEAPAALASRFLAATLDYWQNWVRTLAIPAEWQSEVIRAAITLKLCTYEDTGAVLAALTTSIPEVAGSGRNWDYRFCWLRDSYFVIQALNRLGATQTMEAYLHFIDHIIARSSVGDLQPLYGISGNPDAPEQVATAFDGYQGMGPVRIGNQAASQTQHDVYGSVILATAHLFFDERLVRSGDQILLANLYKLGARAAAVYELPCSGPWELRGQQRPHTFSGAISWAGCDRLARIASHVGDAEAAGRWRVTAEKMRARILTRAWNNKRKAFTGSFGGDVLDASVLLLPELGMLSATHPQFLSTLDLIGKELADGVHLFRYREEDDFGAPKNAFTICGFWYVNALAAAGRIDEARERFTRLLEFRNPLGMLSEDIDPATGASWGNFPQTYSMVGIINSALRLSRPWDALV